MKALKNAVELYKHSDLIYLCEFDKMELYIEILFNIKLT